MCSIFIKNEEGINSIVVYDAMGKVIITATPTGVTSAQITLPSNTKGILIAKVNNEVIKVVCNNWYSSFMVYVKNRLIFKQLINVIWVDCCNFALCNYSKNRKFTI